jgi:hypothetical protein
MSLPARRIDFTHMNSAGATVAYTSNSSNSGVLKVTSGGHTVASINMVGHYTTADFTLGNDGSGHLQITDPPMVEQRPGNAPSRNRRWYGARSQGARLRRSDLRRANRHAVARPRAVGRPCTVSGTAFAEAGAKDLGR